MAQMNIVFRVTRPVGGIATGTEVQCPMRRCKKEGSMVVSAMDGTTSYVVPRSRLAFVRYNNSLKRK
jgi:hypothetical protein